MDRAARTFLPSGGGAMPAKKRTNEGKKKYPGSGGGMVKRPRIWERIGEDKKEPKSPGLCQGEKRRPFSNTKKWFWGR